MNFDHNFLSHKHNHVKLISGETVKNKLKHNPNSDILVEKFEMSFIQLNRHYAFIN